MTTGEFSSGFDTLLNSFAHTAQFGDATSPIDIVCNEYEKSTFLTKAQEKVALGLYNGRNPLGEGFEQTEELRRYLSKLIEEAELSPIATSNGKPLGVSSKSKFFTLPSNPPVWFITYEAVEVTGKACDPSGPLEVIPVRQDEYHKIKKNPFRGANDRRALRLDLSDDNVEIISEYNVTKYYLRYLRKLNPIIVANLDGNDIGGKTTVTECELPDILHQKILEMAVMMALRSKGIGIESQGKEQSR